MIWNATGAQRPPLHCPLSTIHCPLLSRSAPINANATELTRKQIAEELKVPRTFFTFSMIVLHCFMSPACHATVNAMGTRNLRWGVSFLYAKPSLPVPVILPLPQAGYQLIFAPSASKHFPVWAAQLSTVLLVHYLAQRPACCFDEPTASS